MGYLSNVQDGRMVQRALLGDERAFTALVHRHMPAVAAVGRAYSANIVDADDIAQEAFLKAWQSLDTLRTPQRFGGWVVTIARNVARANHNQRSREASKLHDREKEVVMALYPDQQDHGDSGSDQLLHLIADLPDADRELVDLRYYGGKKTREIAELLDLTHPAVRKRLERIRQRLGEGLVATLTPDRAEQSRRGNQATRIALAAIAITPSWKRAAAGTTALAGTSAFVKLLAATALMSPLLVAGSYFLPGETPDVDALPQPVREAATPDFHAAELDPAIAETPQIESTPVILATAGNTATLGGRLVEKDTGEGVFDATVRLRPPTGSEDLEVRTNDSGRYHVDGLLPGRYEVSLHWDEELVRRYPRNRYERQEKLVDLQSGRVHDAVNFTVVRGLSVFGEVHDAQGKPMPGVVVRSWSVPNVVESEVQSDDQGRFEFHGFGTDLPAYFWPRAPGLAMAPHGPLDIPVEGIDHLVLTMEPESALEGQLVDQYGTALPDVSITPWPENMFLLPKDFGATTDASGGFTITGLHASNYRFAINFPEEPGSRRLTNMGELSLASGEHVNGLVLVYEKPGDLTISGRVTDDTGAPQRGIRVTASRLNVQREAETDDEGRYALGELGPGVYLVKTQRVTWAGPAEDELSAEAGAKNVDLVISRTGQVTGVVIDKDTGKPITRFEVMVPLWANRWIPFENADGHFELHDLTAQASTVSARAEGYTRGFCEPFELGSGGTESVQILLEKSGTISVAVFGPDGRPVRDAMVGVEDGAPWGTDNRTDADGLIVIEGVAPRNCAVIASHPDYAPGETEVRVRVGEESTAKIHLAQGGRLTGTILHGGAPLSGVRIELFQRLEENVVGYNSEVTSGEDGTYAFKGIPPGELTLHLNPVFGEQGRIISSKVTFQGNEEKRVDIDVSAGDTTAVFDVNMSAALAEQGGRIRVEFRYEFSSGETESFYTYGAPADLQLQGIRPGTATLEAQYFSASISGVIATALSEQVMVVEGAENRFVLNFVEED